jgi:hypothetical protein
MAQPPSPSPLRTSYKLAIDHSSIQYENDGHRNLPPPSPSPDDADNARPIPPNSTPNEGYNNSQHLSTGRDAFQTDLELERIRQELAALTVRRREIVERIAFLEGVQHLQESTSADSSSHQLDTDDSISPAPSHPAESQNPVTGSPATFTMNLPSQSPPENKALVKMRSFLRHFQQKYPKFMQAVRATRHGKQSFTGVSALWYTEFIKQLAAFAFEMLEESVNEFRAENSWAGEDVIEELRRGV